MKTSDSIFTKAEKSYDSFVPGEMKLDKFVGFNDGKLPLLSSKKEIFQEVNKDFVLIKDLLCHEECLTLIDFFNKSEKVKANVDTVKLKYGTSQKGIQRASFYDKSWAKTLYQRVRLHINSIEVKDNEEYLFVGFNPLIRFIHYNQDHRLIPHYDSEVQVGDNVISIKNMVIYLNNCDSGHTNILEDTRDKNEHKDSFEKYPIIHSQKPTEGQALIFGNDIFHESEKINGNEEKLIITTELCYIKNE
jgi:hypothetical protein